MLTDYAVPVMLTLSAIALITAVFGLFYFAQNPNQPNMLAKLFAGVSWVAFGLDGVMASWFIDERRLLTYVIAWAFIIMGVFTFRSGWRLRKQKQETK